MYYDGRKQFDFPMEYNTVADISIHIKQETIARLISFEVYINNMLARILHKIGRKILYN